MIMEVLASRSLICARCSLKGPSSLFFYLQLANDSSPGITCIKKGVGHWSTCKACHIDKAKCKWIAGSYADPKEGGSISRAVASSFRVASLPQVASSSQVARSSPPQPEVHASVNTLWEIVEAICDIQHRQEECLQ